MLLLGMPLVLLGLVTPPWFEKSMMPSKQAAEAVRTITQMPTTVVVDANNARGAVAFRFSKLKFADLCAKWARRSGLAQRVVVCWDHGLVSQSYEYDGVVHTFAGPRSSADDLIANQVVPRLYEAAKAERVYVVTTDRELIQRVKSAAAASGTAQGNLRLLGTRKFASLLLHAADGGAPDSTAADGHEDRAIATSYDRGAASLRLFAASLRKHRRHERRRRRKPDGYAAPFAERTWHRVVLAERFRRLLMEHRGKHDDKAPIARALEPSFQSAQPQLEQPAASGLLDDVRLDGKQRALILRFGGALSEGLLAPKRAASNADAAMDGDAPRAPPPFRSPRTRRQRRSQRREAEKALLSGGKPQQLSLRGDFQSRRRTHAELATLERSTQLDGLERWLFGDDDVDDPVLGPPAGFL